MASKHNLLEYSFAVEVCRDHPIIKKELENTLKVLYTHSSYAAVQHVIQSMLESLEMIDMQLSYYSDVLKKKGQE